MPDYSFIAQPQVQNPMNTLGSMMDIATKAQALQTSRQDYERGGLALQKEKALLQPAIEQGQAQSRTAVTQATSAQWKLDADQADHARQLAGGLLTNPAIVNGDSKGSVDALTQVEEQMRNSGIPEAKIRVQLAPFYTAAGHAPEKLLGMVKQVVVGGIAPAGQTGAVTPAGPMVTNQAQTGVLNLNPFAPNAGGQAAGIVPGSVVNQQIPLDARQQVSINPVTQSPMTTTKDAFGNVQGVTQAPTGPGVPQLQPGQPAAITANAGTAAADWQQTFAAGQNASQKIGVMQNLKMLAPKAVLGVGQDRIAFIDGMRGLFSSDEKTQGLLSSIIGAKTAQEAKTATDLFIKNANMAGIGGGTDALRGLLESTNPNVHMTKDAVIDAANQVIAQLQLPLIRAQHLKKVANDPAAYTEAATEFNANADPRVLQYPTMNAAQRAEMKKAMNPQERVEFGNKLRFFQHFGYLK